MIFFRKANPSPRFNMGNSLCLKGLIKTGVMPRQRGGTPSWRIRVETLHAVNDALRAVQSSIISTASRGGWNYIADFA